MQINNLEEIKLKMQNIINRNQESYDHLRLENEELNQKKDLLREEQLMDGISGAITGLIGIQIIIEQLKKVQRNHITMQHRFNIKNQKQLMEEVAKAQKTLNVINDRLNIIEIAEKNNMTSWVSKNNVKDILSPKTQISHGEHQ